MLEEGLTDLGSWVALRTGPQAPVVRVAPGGLVGRLANAALRIDDPKVSEAHALVSHRGRRLRLLALRRWFEVDGERASETDLCPGQHIRLAPGIELLVEDVHLATAVLAARTPDARPVELEASVYSVVQDAGRLLVQPGYLEPALGRLWSTGTGWSARIGEGEHTTLYPGCVLEVEGGPIRITALPLAPAASTMSGAALDPPLRIVLRHSTVHLFRQARPPAVISGVPAQILTEVALMGAPVAWEIVAKEIWRRLRNRDRLRKNWDRNNRTLRAKLEQLQIRTDLVRADGHGHVELFLMPGDLVIDET